MQIKLITKSGKALEPYLDDLARLRLTVFREYPYLYEGTAEYEHRYLQAYMANDRAIAILAFDGDKVIGASTGVPLEDEHDAFIQAFTKQGISPQDFFYCGESVLLPEYRGQGLYKSFFLGREQCARELGFAHICFCAVVRPDDHPAKPDNYVALNDVWCHFGYQPVHALITHFSWTDIGQAEQSEHPMQFWMKDL